MDGPEVLAATCVASYSFQVGCRVIQGFQQVRAAYRGACSSRAKLCGAMAEREDALGS